MPRPPPTTHRVAEPIVVGIVPPMLTLSPSRVAAGQEGDRASDGHRVALHVAGDRNGAADGHRLVDGLVSADGERVAEHHALAASTAPLAPSLAPRLSRLDGGGIGTHA